MNAIICQQHGSPDVMQYVETPKPQPSVGEVLVQAEAIGVNYVDTMRRSGKHPTAPNPPFTPGIELCGRIVAVGEGVDGFKNGERVIARCVSEGAYAEFVCAEARFTIACPENIPAEDAAALFVNGQTAYHALITLGQVNAGDSVLITAAAGGVGVCAVQIAHILDAHVIAVAGTEEKLQTVKDLGADICVSYAESGGEKGSGVFCAQHPEGRPGKRLPPPFLRPWHEEVLAATNGEGADLILESVGGEIFQQCLKCWADRGRLIVYGKASGTPGIVTGDDLLFGHRKVYGLAVGKVIVDTDILRSSMRQLLEWHEQGKLRMLIGHTFPLSEAAEAHRLLESRQSQGKIVLLPRLFGEPASHIA